LPTTVVGFMYPQFSSHVHMENTGGFSITSSVLAHSRAEMTSETHVSTSILLLLYVFCHVLLYLSNEITTLHEDPLWFAVTPAP
jgi:hypothetical protein